ncbi:MAG: HAD family hydrolase, partial [Bacteroidales bacterium]|nr:HAD family hydrolase [Bacteroidales bacterium]
MNKLKIIGFDADDTLWENGLYFRKAEQEFALMLRNFIDPDSLHARLYAVEMKNMPTYGYGAMAYTLSLIETALDVIHSAPNSSKALSQGKIDSGIIERILGLGRGILSHPIELLPDVESILPVLQARYRLIIITKGDILDQERKLSKSGLLPYFHHIEIVSEKHEENYRDLLRRLDVAPAEFMMVGNSLKSDVLPVLNIGGQAVHVPAASIWEH